MRRTAVIAAAIVIAGLLVAAAIIFTRPSEGREESRGAPRPEESAETQEPAEMLTLDTSCYLLMELPPRAFGVLIDYWGRTAQTKAQVAEAQTAVFNLENELPRLDTLVAIPIETMVDETQALLDDGERSSAEFQEAGLDVTKSCAAVGY